MGVIIEKIYNISKPLTCILGNRRFLKYLYVELYSTGVNAGTRIYKNSHSGSPTAERNPVFTIQYFTGKFLGDGRRLIY
jgi:hypothetical protein